MFTHKQFQSLFDYHWHTTLRLLSEAEKLPAEADADGAIYSIAAHLLRVDRAWRAALEVGTHRHNIKPSDYPTITALKYGFEAERTAWQATIASFSPQTIEQDITLTDWAGKKITLGVWQVFHQVLIHGMQHHSEIAYLLTAKGHSPGDIDYLFYALAQPSA